MKDIMRERRVRYHHDYIILHGNIVYKGAGEQEVGPGRCQEQGEEREEGTDEAKTGKIMTL